MLKKISENKFAVNDDIDENTTKMNKTLNRQYSSTDQ